MISYIILKFKSQLDRKHQNIFTKLIMLLPFKLMFISSCKVITTEKTPFACKLISAKLLPYDTIHRYVDFDILTITLSSTQIP